MKEKENLHQKLNITTAQQCHHEFDLLKSTLILEESEDTWLKIDASLKRFTAAVRGGACDFPDDFLRRWKETDTVRGIVCALSTERTRLSGTALDLLGSTARLGSHWDSAIPFYIPTIIKLLGRASKIYVTRASIALNTLIRGTRSAAFIPLLLDGLSDKSLSLRVGCADALLCCLGGSPERDRDQLELITQPNVNREGLNKRVVDIENAIKIGGRDRDPKVRTIFKRIWDLYQRQWPARAASLSQPFTPTIRRYLGLSKSFGASSQPVFNPTPAVTASQSHLTKRSGPTTSSSNDRPVSTSTHQLSSSKSASGNGPSKPTSWPHSAAANHPSGPATATSQHQKAASSESAAFHLASSVPHPRRLPPEPSASMDQPHAMKRSNSTMRARPQRVAFPGLDSSAPIQRATRVPLGTNASSNRNHPTHDSTTAPFRPARTASGSSQVAPPTRALPRRADPPPLANENVNLRKSIKAQDGPDQVMVNQSSSRRAFKPTKSSKLEQQHMSVPSSTINKLIPEALRIPALTPLPPSPENTPPLPPESSAAIATSVSTKASILSQTSISTQASISTQLSAPILVPAPALQPLPMPNSIIASTSLPSTAPVLLQNPVLQPTTPIPPPPPPPVFAFTGNICTRLPDDLIVPMSIPLPPSPNSPYLSYKPVNKSKALRPTTTPRKPNTPRNRRPDPRTPGTLTRKAESIQRSNKKPSQLLVDFDHEDTIWVPSAPVLNQDLADLAPAFEFGRWNIEESDEEEAEEGPEEKKLRLEERTITPNRNHSDNSSSEEDVTPIQIQTDHRTRDPSIFHWDKISSDSSNDSIKETDPSEKTVSCLKEQPLFLAGDITVTDNSTDFLNGIRDQSTPVATYRSSPDLRSLSLT
ncbi:hypothetical protein CROQUDRAFT_718888 [Cronartium quercuum f. sp. fusiforme G11]|uniref:CLASP N-terminal domain-containing protein n=1 Tax=Cronartium quercuum f. sp. fusiforme G11 TaxID=708437 RepID=A0A9P6T5E3_9BASI|nr:hypothetical protein CROQUDRAFT_718888 [Cronartium quercuum f. sp. fusiforme G11]